jgi:hypothetical protein
MRFKYLAVLLILMVVTTLLWHWMRPSASPSDSRFQTDFVEPSSTHQPSSAVGNNKSEPSSPLQSPQPPSRKIYRKAVSGSNSALPITGRSRRQRAAMPDGRDSSPNQRYRGLVLSQPVQIDQHKKLVLGARAVPRATYNRSYGPVLFEHHGYSIVAIDTNADSTWSELVYHSTDRPLVVNAANGSLEVVTGTLMVKLENIRDAESFAGRQGLNLLGVDEAVQVAYYRVPENFHLLSGVSALVKGPGVLRVEMEVFRDHKGVW